MRKRVSQNRSLDYLKEMERVNKVKNCKYKEIKYPFELSATLEYKTKKQTFGSYHMDASNSIQFKVAQP